MTEKYDGFWTKVVHHVLGDPRRDAQRDDAVPRIGSGTLRPQRGEDRWQPLEMAMRQGIEDAYCGQVRVHRGVEPEAIYVLQKIILSADDNDWTRCLEAFLAEFDQRARVNWVKRIWPEDARDGINRDALWDVELPPPTGSSAGADAYSEALAQSEVASGGKVVIEFVGIWDRQNEIPTPSPAPAGSAGRLHATLLIRDAQGQRTVEMREQQLTLGKEGGIPMHGTYVSRRHARLFIEGGRLWVENSGATNGVWLQMTPVLVGAPREIRDKAEIRLGEPSQTEDKCPRISVTRHVAHVSGAGATPVLGGGEATPVLVCAQSAAPPLLFLSLKLADGGTPHRVRVSRFPFTVGRSSECDYSLPEENRAVSGRHLRLVALDSAGVRVEENSSRGTYLAGERCTGSFLLPMNEPLMLGDKSLDDSYRPVELTALPAKGEGE